tara:strand:+ start:34 stop:753 length:720 start_codon:yes stop_codon:yes gene_type:complete
MNIYIILVSLVIIAILITIYIFYKRLYKNAYLIINQPHNSINGKNMNNNMVTTVCNKGITWSYNFWLYIDDWGYKFGKRKYILQSDNMSIWLDEKLPDLHIELNIFNKPNQKMVYKDIPIQKWLNYALILDNRNFDLFINGHLYKTMFLDNVPEQLNVTNINLFSDGGISGYISQFKYFSYNIDRSRIKLEYNFGFRGMWYTFFVTRFIYKIYLFFNKILNPNYSNFNTNIEDISCGYL